MSEKSFRPAVCKFLAVLGLLTALSVGGCGSSEPTVIEHTEDYQLTEQEAANKKAEEDARMNAGR